MVNAQSRNARLHDEQMHCSAEARDAALAITPHRALKPAAPAWR
ncbi:hypothetical protein XOC_0891 [Xanthomonas oryzae pv. oryzicola BLS256]|uniref:Uncharacterized protein n=1 Tax=Xanthomonas oryzae pv. oryzicola (strain BLS256) TaxID=383407 RepID=G7TDV8_XANOB|nr:hypothetical protein XOC_0891 [Xanthomonas oryzae pv. oryzicola BLS256]QEO99034.1 hypothetical protein XOCgx_4047 [Xanthomonas oryzae pv. oryzicola]